MTTSTSGLSQSNFIWRNALVSDLLHHIDFVKDAYLVVGASDVVRSRLGLSLEQPRDGGGMDLEEACSGGGGPLAFRNHLSNLGLLLRGELGAASPDAALLTGGIDSGLSAFPQHGALELREGPTICIIIRPAGVVVSIASVKLRNPAPASPSCSMIVSTSRRERDSRSSFQTTTTSPLRS